VLVFGDLELDEARFELRCAGRPVHVEPRVFELLIYLARHRDRVVTKDELLREVWQGRFVSETALTHAVAEARKAIGGGDPQASWIRTIHGRGYRFVPPGGSDPAVAPPDNPAATPVPRRRIRPLYAVGLAITLVLAAVWLIRSRNPGEAASEAAAPTRLGIALVPLVVEPPETELRLLALSLVDLLSQRLAAVPGVALRPPDYSRDAGLEASQLGDFARRVGAQVVIAGKVGRSTQTGRGQLELTLHDLRPGAPDRPWRPWRYDLPLLDESADLADFRSTIEAISRRVVEGLRLDIDPAADPVSAPGDLEAYRGFLLAFGQSAEVSCIGSGAAELLRESLARDPEYLPAWQAYASAEYNLAWACGDSREHYERALTALERADAIATTRLAAMLRAVMLAETGRVEEGFAALREASARWPGDAGLEFQQAQLLHYAGLLEDAQRHYERSLLADPLFATEGWIPRTPLYREEYERFLEQLPAIESPIFRYYRACAELRRDRKEEAKRLLEPVFRMNPGDVFARLSQAMLAVLEGDNAEAVLILDHLVLERERLGGSDGEVTYKIAQLYADAGQAGKAARQVARAVEQGFFCVPCFAGDAALDTARPMPEYREALVRAEARQAEFRSRFGL